MVPKKQNSDELTLSKNHYDGLVQKYCISFTYVKDKRPKIDIKDYTFSGLDGETVGRVPGEVKGRMFVVENCKNCNIYIYDNTSTVTVDECENCNFFFGPIQQSIFIRDCSKCNFVVACQQFRLRDCQKLDVFLCCATQPIIESSSGLRLSCFTYFYPELAGQFKAAELSVFNNNWSNLHDFTQDHTEKHYTLLPEDAKSQDYVPLPNEEKFSNLQIDLDPIKSVVPVSQGSRRKTSNDTCLLVFFYDGSSQDCALKFIDELKNIHPECILIQTKEIKMQASDAERVFGTDMYAEAASQGPVIGLEYNGDDCIQYCQETLESVCRGSTTPVFISQSRETAAQQAEQFYNYADLQMGI